MFLSNTRKCLLTAAVCASVLTACGSSQTSVNTGVTTPSTERAQFPFSVREPEVYQGEIVVMGGGYEDRYFIARKGDKWRRDHFRGPELLLTELRSDAAYVIDHRKKVYAAEPPSGEDVAGFDPASTAFFRGKQYHDFDEIGRGDGTVRYQVRKGEDLKDDILITIDEASGMIVRQEFTSATGESFVYELRDLRLEVADDVFKLPPSYKKVEWKTFRSPLSTQK